MPDVRLNERIVVLVNVDLKQRYGEMCEAIGENQSDHIRKAWEIELALYEASKAK